jgi:hypothetical protein
MTDKEAMAMALDALTYKKWFCLGMGKPNDPRLEAAITALKERLADHPMREVQRLGQEIEQEPTAKYSDIVSDGGLDPRNKFDAQVQRKPLTNGEIYTAYITATNQTLRATDERLAFAFARAIEAAYGIKGNT